MSIQTILIFFVITAIGGATLATLVFKDKKRPLLIVAVHGILALSGIALLTYYSAMQFELNGNKFTPYSSLVFFSFAAVGGFYMFFRDKYQKAKIQKWMPLIHGGLALAGIISLVMFIYK